MVALSVLKPTEREILEGNKLALTSSDQSPINCEKEKDKTSKNWRRCQPNLKRAFLQKKSLRNIVCVLKDGTGDALKLKLKPKNRTRCQENLIEISLRNVKKNVWMLFVCTKGWDSRCTSRIGSFSQDTCAGQTKEIQI